MWSLTRAMPRGFQQDMRNSGNLTTSGPRMCFFLRHIFRFFTILLSPKPSCLLARPAASWPAQLPPGQPSCLWGSPASHGPKKCVASLELPTAPTELCICSLPSGFGFGSFGRGGLQIINRRHSLLSFVIFSFIGSPYIVRGT